MTWCLDFFAKLKTYSKLYPAIHLRMLSERLPEVSMPCGSSGLLGTIGFVLRPWVFVLLEYSFETLQECMLKYSRDLAMYLPMAQMRCKLRPGQTGMGSNCASTFTRRNRLLGWRPSVSRSDRTLRTGLLALLLGARSYEQGSQGIVTNGAIGRY